MLVPQAIRFPDRITPPGPIDAEPVIPLNTGLRFELKSAKWSAAVCLSGALDFPENVQFRHRHSGPGFTPQWL